MDALRTSEFWAAVIAALLGVLVQFGILDQQMAQMAQQLAVGLVAVVIGRVCHKAANGAVPFRPIK